MIINKIQVLCTFIPHKRFDSLLEIFRTYFNLLKTFISEFQAL